MGKLSFGQTVRIVLCSPQVTTSNLVELFHLSKPLFINDQRMLFFFVCKALMLMQDVLTTLHRRYLMHLAAFKEKRLLLFKAYVAPARLSVPPWP